MASALTRFAYNHFSNYVLPFYRECISAEWGTLSDNVKSLMALLMRFIGIGFLTSAVSMGCAIREVLDKKKLSAVLFLLISGIFQFGLSLINWKLHRKYGVDSPWKESIASFLVTFAVVVILF